MEKGILPGADVEDDYNRRHEPGRVLSHYGIFAPWDARNSTTKTRVAGCRNRHMPMVALYIPSQDLIRQGGRIKLDYLIIWTRRLMLKALASSKPPKNWK